MRLLHLALENIGPFKNDSIAFIKENDNHDKPPVTIITGENGSGKTIIIDAIRGLFFGINPTGGRGLERIIYSDPNHFKVDLGYELNGVAKNMYSESFFTGNSYWLQPSDYQIVQQFHGNFTHKPLWMFDYWTSKLATDGFNVGNLTTINAQAYLNNALSGTHQNVEISRLICFFDYLKSSDAAEERELGIALFQHLKNIIKVSLNNGEFSHVARMNLEPIVKQNGKEITLDKLSSGNLYLIQRLVSLLGQAYSIYSLNKKNDNIIVPLEHITHIPGLLLIDEAENHLHPKWQKTFLKNILKIFPNLQIIVTTHSPFIVSSIANANIYVCEAKDDHSVIVDKTDFYANKPIGEILTTELFNTEPFNAEISALIERRKLAIEKKDFEKAKNIEAQLIKENPQYFSFFEIDTILENLKKNP